jgi:hypothetical protein
LKIDSTKLSVVLRRPTLNRFLKKPTVVKMSNFDETTGRITGQLQAFNKLKDSNFFSISKVYQICPTQVIVIVVVIVKRFGAAALSL